MNNINTTFKKIYLEVTNICNLNCPFCLKQTRDKSIISKKDFLNILNEIKPYTKYLYFHVMGEPLMHNEINDLIEDASKDFFINITTNGYLIKKIKTNKIRQINISLQSYDVSNGKSLDDYLSDIFDFENTYSHNTYVNYRIWVNNKYTNEIISKLQERYGVAIDLNSKNTKLKDNVFISLANEFNWPDDNLYDRKVYEGKCYATKDHVAILSNGEVTACCLDGNGKLSFGNIFKTGFKNIIESDKFLDFRKNIMNGKRTNELCKHCNFIEKDKF